MTRRQAGKRARDPVGERRHRLAARRRMVEGRPEPALVAVTVPRQDRLEGETLPVAEPDLPEVVDRDRVEPSAAPHAAAVSRARLSGLV